MRYVREMTRKEDPRISVLLPKVLIEELMQLAKENKRRYQDEFIKRIARTLRFPEAYENLEAEIAQKILRFYQ